MKAKKTSAAKPARTRHSADFKEQALLRAEKDGVAQAAKDLNLTPSQIYAWRQRKQLTALTTDEQRLQQAEIARLKREVARLKDEAEFLKKAAAYFAKEPTRGTP
jgi:transposase